MPPKKDVVWILEDTSTYQDRRPGRFSQALAPISIRLYRLTAKGNAELVGETSYKAGTKSGHFKAQIALELLSKSGATKGVVVAGHRLAHGTRLVSGLVELGLDVVAELPGEPRASDPGVAIWQRLESAPWRKSRLKAPDSRAHYTIADLGPVAYRGLKSVRCVAISTGGITDFRRGLIVGITTLSRQTTLPRTASLLGWARWIRFATRRVERAEKAAVEKAAGPAMRDNSNLSVVSRINIGLAKRQDLRGAATDGLFHSASSLRNRLKKNNSPLKVVELFAGAGGMGLGFLMAGAHKKNFRVVFSGEIDPIYVNTLNRNHNFLRDGGFIDGDSVPEPSTPSDLRSATVMDRVQAAARQVGGVDIVIGGPPCQGFSTANRNSGSSRNPNNQLVETYLDYVVRLRPRVFMMENVQGILWTARHGQSVSVAEHVAGRLKKAGYQIFPKLLDAAWYGVPQHRNRFFLLGLHSDLGYSPEDFGEWGPFPRPTHGPSGTRPYVTVREAIGDLPKIANGASEEELEYAAASSSEFVKDMRSWSPRNIIWDHVTSRHADYVIDRYRNIPAGGNWSDISKMMTNYSALERTHSNIYKRLEWDDASITIGHYRKAMLIHPAQHRGLSLREASRLQGFPDWFRFAGGANSLGGGLNHKQQQLGNAVCPLVTRAIANYLTDV